MCCARSLFRLCYFYVICVFCHLVVLVRLSVPVQVIDWKDSSPKWPCVDKDVKPCSLTHSLGLSLLELGPMYASDRQTTDKITLNNNRISVAPYGSLTFPHRVFWYPVFHLFKVISAIQSPAPDPRAWKNRPSPFPGRLS